MPANNPTQRTYKSLDDAYRFFNRKLFGNKLPGCLITMQRYSKAYGFFAGGRFGTIDGKEITDEIALNPMHFKDRTSEQSLSTLVHEMTHLQQHHFGKPSRAGYHNKEWAQLMRNVGLIPSSTGAPGGKETGQFVSHYIEEKGRFETVCSDFMKSGFEALYVEQWSESEKEKAKRKSASKTKYTCPSCELNAWAKPDLHIVCGECEERLVAEEPDDDA